MMTFSEIPIYAVLLLLTLHFVGDFLFQTTWMALNKSKDNKALTAHVAVYSVCFMAFGLEFVAITFVLHWITDWCTSRLTSRWWFIDDAGVDDRKRTLFFGTIGFDQLIHGWCLVLTYVFLTGH